MYAPHWGNSPQEVEMILEETRAIEPGVLL
jgi:hypothetical protein